MRYKPGDRVRIVQVEAPILWCHNRTATVIRAHHQRSMVEVRLDRISPEERKTVPFKRDYFHVNVFQIKKEQ